MEAHLFAIYFPDLKLGQAGQLVIQDKDIMLRITGILRLQEGEQIILFRSGYYGQFTIKSIEKKSINLTPHFVKTVEGAKEFVTLHIGLLKKESFEEVLYTATELGVSVIQPILSEKIHKNWWNAQLRPRFEKIIISAAEQAKNFNLPILRDPVKFAEFIDSKTRSHGFDPSTSLRMIAHHDRFLPVRPEQVEGCEQGFVRCLIYFDANGKNILDAVPVLQASETVDILIGPEGDFSQREKSLLSDLKIQTIKLTPTILRATEAVSVGVGSIKSILNR